MKTKVIVLGGGIVGSAIARDLAASGGLSVIVADLSKETLARIEEQGLQGIQADLSRPEAVASVVSDHDLVVGAVPGSIGFSVVKACLEAGKDVVDISFFPEDAMALDELARRNGVRCIVDFGVAPGCSNLIFGHASATLSRVDSYVCYVGGLPRVRQWPWEYKATFSPSDVLAEYIRPARFIAGGRPVAKPALSDPELIDFEGVGTVEAFLTDGLRTLLRTEGVARMEEKTCRYPGYRDKIILLRESGFLDPEPVRLNGVAVSPRDLTAKLLIKAMRPEDEDLTVFRAQVEGLDEKGEPVMQTWEMVDRYDRQTGTSSMARTTGYTCTAGVRLLAGGIWTEPGVAPPELVGRDRSSYEFVMQELEQRGVVFETS